MGEYSGNHPRFSKRQEEHYDAKMAHDKDLSASARLHYLENDETHHPAKMSAELKDPVLSDDMNLENPVYAGGPEGHLGGTHPAKESSRDWGHGKHEYLRHRNAAGVETKTGDVGGGKYGKGGHFKAWEKNN